MGAIFGDKFTHTLTGKREWPRWPAELCARTIAIYFAIVPTLRAPRKFALFPSN